MHILKPIPISEWQRAVLLAREYEAFRQPARVPVSLSFDGLRAVTLHQPFDVRAR